MQAQPILQWTLHTGHLSFKACFLYLIQLKDSLRVYLSVSSLRKEADQGSLGSDYGEKMYARAPG